MMVSCWVEASQEKMPSGVWSLWSCQSLVMEWYQFPWAVRVAASASSSVSATHNWRSIPTLGAATWPLSRSGPCRCVSRSLPIHVHQLTDACGWAETDEMVAMPGGIDDALRLARSVPQRRIRLLQGMEFHRYIMVLVVLACERQSLVRQPCKNAGPLALR